MGLYLSGSRSPRRRRECCFGPRRVQDRPSRLSCRALGIGRLDLPGNPRSYTRFQLIDSVLQRFDHALERAKAPIQFHLGKTDHRAKFRELLAHGSGEPVDLVAARGGRIDCQANAVAQTFSDDVEMPTNLIVEKALEFFFVHPSLSYPDPTTSRAVGPVLVGPWSQPR